MMIESVSRLRLRYFWVRAILTAGRTCARSCHVSCLKEEIEADCTGAALSFPPLLLLG